MNFRLKVRKKLACGFLKKAQKSEVPVFGEDLEWKTRQAGFPCDDEVVEVSFT